MRRFSPHVRLDEQTDAAVCVLIENSVSALAGRIIPSALAHVPAVKKRSHWGENEIL
jgi:hypothetical protein